MEFDPFPEEFRSQLLAAAGTPLRSLLTDAPDLSLQWTSCTWHESCRVVVLDLPAEFSPTDPIASYLDDRKQLWHHQIKVNGAPLLYARSIIEGEQCRLCKLVRSELAQRFDDTLTLLESFTDDATVRLLVIPVYDEEVFALFNGQDLQGFVPLKGSEGWPSVPLTGPPLPTTSLLENLKGRPRSAGLRSVRSDGTAPKTPEKAEMNQVSSPPSARRA